MSSTRQLLQRLKIIDAQSMTGTSTINSTAIKCTGFDSCSIQLSWSGTPNGTFVVQIPVTFDVSGGVTAWGTLPVTNTSGSTLTAAGSAGNHQIDVPFLSFSDIRVSYTNSSSTGTLDAWITLKGR